MKKRNILLTSLAVFALGINNVNALEAKDGWTKVESGKVETAIDKITALEEKLASRVEELNLASITNNMNELYRYRIEVEETDQENYKEISNDKSFSTEEEALDWATTNEPKQTGWSFIQNIIKAFKLDKVFNLTRYEDKTAAETAKTEFENSLDAGSTTTITEVRDESGDKTTLVEYNKKFTTFSAAEEAATKLYEDNHDYIITAEIITLDPEYQTTETIELQKTFATKTAAEDYIAEYEKLGYTVTYKIEEIFATKTFEEKYEERLQAEQALADFLIAYPQTTETAITEVRDTTEDNEQTTLGTTTYSTEEDATAAATELTKDQHDTQVIATVRQGQQTTQSALETIESEQFDTELEALDYIETLKQQGYDTTNLQVVLVPYEESTWQDQDGVVIDPGTSDGESFSYNHFDITLLTSFTKIDQEGNSKTVTGNITVSTVKINNSSITMNSPTKDPNGSYYEYTSQERHNLSITENSLVEITGTVTYTENGQSTTLPFTVSGYLSDSQNVCGGNGDARGYDLEFESITIINNRVIVDSNIINKYKVTGTATRTVTTDVWYVDTKTITKGYDYQVTATGLKSLGYQVTGTALKDIYQNAYTLTVTKTTKDYDYEVEGFGEKTYYDIISKYVRTTNVDWIIESMSFGKGGDVIEELPPQTGVNNNSSMNFFIAITALVIAVLKKIMLTF